MRRETHMTQNYAETQERLARLEKAIVELQRQYKDLHDSVKQDIQTFEKPGTLGVFWKECKLPNYFMGETYRESYGKCDIIINHYSPLVTIYVTLSNPDLIYSKTYKNSFNAVFDEVGNCNFSPYLQDARSFIINLESCS